MGGTAARVAEESYEHYTWRDLVSLDVDGLDGIPSITAYQVGNDLLPRPQSSGSTHLLELGIEKSFELRSRAAH